MYFAQTLNATSTTPTVFQAVASDHVIHGSNISLAGFTTGTSPNRNLADFFQVAIDPQGMAMIAWADDSVDFVTQGNDWAVAWKTRGVEGLVGIRW